MARPTWIDVTDAEVAIDEYIVQDTTEALKDNPAATRIQIIPVNEDEQSTTATSWTTLFSVRVFVLNVGDYSGISRKIVGDINVHTTASHTGSYRLRDSASGDVSNTVTTTATAYDDFKQPELTVDTAWLSGVGVWRTIQVQAQVTSGGTAYAKSPDSVSWYQEY